MILAEITITEHIVSGNSLPELPGGMQQTIAQ
jgi:hypothetical protein